MKFKPLFLLTASLFLFSSHSALFAVDKLEDKPSQLPEFPIFVEASKTSKITEKANLRTPLVKIFKQNDWIKVADTSNGLVGWIHEEDYKKAVETISKPRTQSV